MTALLKERSSRGVNILSTGDVHLGHQRTPTYHILDVIKKYIINDNLKYDILVINGDFFDRLLYFFSDVVYEICEVFNILLDYCAHYNVKIRAVKGTPLHDWNQMLVLVTLNRARTVKVDVKYIDTLTFEIIEPFGISVIYIPDEYNENSLDTYKEVKDLIRKNNLTKVDFIFIHDGFDYQLPMDKNAHNAKAYSDLVNYYVVESHIHTHSRRYNIWAIGSLDRLKHGEEEAKGFAMFHLKNGKCKGVFIENKDAKIYKTVDAKGCDLESTKVKLDRIAELPTDSYIRLVMTRLCPIYNQRHAVRSIYPQFNFDYLIEDGLIKEDSSLSLIESLEITPVTTFSKDNVKSLLLPHITNPDMDLVSELIDKLI